MKKTVKQLTAKDVRKILDTKFRETGLDKVPARLDLLERIANRIDRNQKTLDQIDEVARVLRENNQNLKNLYNLQDRLDLLDKIYEKVDKIAGDTSAYRGEQSLNSDKLSKLDETVQKITKHLHLQAL